MEENTAYTAETEEIRTAGHGFTVTDGTGDGDLMSGVFSGMFDAPAKMEPSFRPEKGQTVWSRPVKHRKGEGPAAWKVSAVYPDQNDGLGEGYLLVSGSMQWRATDAAAGVTVFGTEEEARAAKRFA